MDPEGSLPTMYQAGDSMKFVQWLNIYTMRMFFPYNAFFDWVSHKFSGSNEDWVIKVSDFNARFLDAATVKQWLVLDWLMLAPITVQAIVMWVLTLPAWPFVMNDMSMN